MAKVKTATRTLSNAGRLRTLVIATSHKAEGVLVAESLVEYDGLLELLADPDIASLRVQPETLEFEMDGRPVSYTPDVRFVRRDGRIGFREFKPPIATLDNEVVAKLDGAQEVLTKQGYEFEVRDSDTVRRGYRIENLRLLKRYAAWPTSQAFQRRVLDFVGGQDDVCLQGLRDLVGPHGYGALYRMLWERQLRVDLDGRTLGALTRIWRA
jgi:hypothetical protein